MSVRKWLNDLEEVDQQLAAARRELQLVQGELNTASSDHDDAGFRMIVSETAQASLQLRNAAAGIEKLRLQRDDAAAVVRELITEREQLVRRISAPASSRG